MPSSACSSLRPPVFTFVPYTTLFRSELGGDVVDDLLGGLGAAGGLPDGGERVLPGGGVVRGHGADGGGDPAELVVVVLGQAGIGGDDPVRGVRRDLVDAGAVGRVARGGSRSA